MTSWFPGNEGKDIGKDFGEYGVGVEGKDGLLPGSQEMTSRFPVYDFLVPVL